MPILFILYFLLIIYLIISTLHFNFYISKRYGSDLNLANITNDKQVETIHRSFIQIRIAGSSWFSQSKHNLGICSNGICFYSKVNDFYLFIPSSSIQSIKVIKSPLLPLLKSIHISHNRVGIPKPIVVFSPSTKKIMRAISNLPR